MFGFGFFLFVFLGGPHSVACGILIPWPGIKPMPPSLEDQGSPQNATFLTGEKKPTLTHHNQPKYIHCLLEFTLDVVHSMDLDRRVIIYIHHYNIIQSIFIGLKVFCVWAIHPSLTPGTHWSFYCLHCYAFSRMSYSWTHSVCSIFRTDVASLVIRKNKM